MPDPYAQIDIIAAKLETQGYSPDYAIEKAAELIDEHELDPDKDALQWD